jgi:hypothetical protein
MRFRNASIFAGFAILISSVSAQAQKPPAEKPQDELAAQVRTQGFVCGKSLGAVRDKKRSKPDYAVWTLICNNAVYRVSRAPDMLAKIEPLQR